MKNFIFLALVLFIFSACQKEEIQQLTPTEDPQLNALLRQYPEEITMDNWEEFIEAPQAVIDYFDKKEKENPELVREYEIPATDNGYRNGGCGWVKAFNGSWNYLAGTLVQWGSESDITTGTAGLGGYNYSFDNNGSGDLCFFHQGITNGNFPQTEWVSGVTAYDYWLIQEHIFGRRPFTSIREYIAADVSGNQIISSFDLLLIERLVLNHISSFPNHEQPVSYLMAGSYDYHQNQFDNGIITSSYFGLIPEGCDGVYAGADVNRYAVKIGDVNGSWNF